MIAVLALIGCNTDPLHPGDHGPGDPPGGTIVDPPDHNPPDDPPATATCDAGDNVWVQRVFPLVLGRKPHGASEVNLWADLAKKEGRPAVIRALTLSVEFDQWWKVQLSDMIYASRDGFGSDETCFEKPQLNEHDGDLAQFIRRNAPDQGTYGKNFNMADVLIDAMIADDISVVYQANLFAKTNYTDIMVFDTIAAETEVRKYQGDQLLEVYTDRNMACMTCHNSEFSVTDDPDPALDRAWGRGGLFEKALFGTSTGGDIGQFYSANKGYGVVQSFYYFDDTTNYNVEPWGLDSCGSFAHYSYDYDLLGNDAYFGGNLGEGGSLWEMERLFASGVDSMAEGGLEIGDGAEVDPGQAFAYLTAQNFVDQTWRLAFGNRLLLPYGMSRNEEQQKRLAAMTDHFVSDGWSLTELLVDITSDPYFNAGLPESCNSEPYGMAPVVDPYTVMDEGALQNNGPGDLVHRQTARTLLRSMYSALDWGQPPEYFGFSYNNDDDRDLQVALGVFLNDATPGFNGVDFQGALTWESNFHDCSAPTGGGGYMRTLYDEGYTADATVEDLVLSLKDRLLSHGEFDDQTERRLVENLMQMDLETKIQDGDPMTIGRNLGLLCGVITQSPEFMMTVEPRPVGPVPKVDPGASDACALFATLTAAAGLDETCVVEEEE